jgi:hypothetical protein
MIREKDQEDQFHQLNQRTISLASAGEVKDDGK